MPQLVLDVPEDLAAQAERAARSAKLPVEAFILRGMRELVGRRSVAAEIEYWDSIDLSNQPDSVLTSFIHTPVAKSVADRIGELQDAQGERKLTADEQAEHERLMRIVHTSTMMKAIARGAWKDRHGTLPEKIEADW
jgi:hypothetical protein